MRGLGLLHLRILCCRQSEKLDYKVYTAVSGRVAEALGDSTTSNIAGHLRERPLSLFLSLSLSLSRDLPLANCVSFRGCSFCHLLGPLGHIIADSSQARSLAHLLVAALLSTTTLPANRPTTRPAQYGLAEQSGASILATTNCDDEISKSSPGTASPLTSVDTRT